ncbi:hypothetical protein [Oryzibacter oryziterrae]|uniref:hypothetical protein n=1 Tax=Oryzibacter oryziterrae TaxID=2766474 RepID=UPI001F32AC43|nr:hypothetical protein [Oryzibacter oryziterrae]
MSKIISVPFGPLSKNTPPGTLSAWAVWYYSVAHRRTAFAVVLLDSHTHRCYILETANDSFRFNSSSAAAAAAAAARKDCSTKAAKIHL